jgi:hypothetical protein
MAFHFAKLAGFRFKPGQAIDREGVARAQRVGGGRMPRALVGGWG